MPSGPIHHQYGVFTRRDGSSNQIEVTLHTFAIRLGHDQRRGNKAAVALANKNARIIWALATGGNDYAPQTA